MINFVATSGHTRCFRHLSRQLGNSSRWSYARLFRQSALPGGTWVFTDHERLADFELVLAARIATELEQAGARVLNHPARVLGRVELLQALNKAGINRFGAWRCEDLPEPDRFPVFIRNAFDHDTRDVALIPDQAALDAALSSMRLGGIPLRGKLVVEYAGEEVAPGIWQRFATYRVADRVVAHHNVVDFRWAAKDVKDRARLVAHPMYPTFIENERRFVEENLYNGLMRRVFDIAGIDYGRADFSLVSGQPQIFEINTNPMHGSHDVVFRTSLPERVETQRLSEKRLYEAFAAIDTPASGKIPIEHADLVRQQGFLRLFSGPRRP